MATSPITALTRGPVVSPNGNNLVRLMTFLDPTPTQLAATAEECCGDGEFLDEARFCGAFAPGNNWLVGWTAMSQYGLTSQSRVNEPIHGTEVATDEDCDPVHYTDGDWSVGSQVTFRATNLSSGCLGVFFAFSFAPANPVEPLAGVSIGFLGLGPDLLIPDFNQGALLFEGIDANGESSHTLGATIPPGLFSQVAYTQAFPLEPSFRLSSTNAQRHLLP